ncbi:MAG: hypothetical protein R3F49_06915 [Planctomycetota bacterium]
MRARASTAARQPRRFFNRYRPLGPVAPAAPRHARLTPDRAVLPLCARPRGLTRGEIHHAPWPLRPGEAELESCDMTRLVGAPLEGPPSLVHVADPIDVVAWWPSRVGRR